MRNITSSLGVWSLLVASTIAQSTLSTLTGGTNSGNSGGGLYFDLQVHNTITITQIDCLTGSPTANVPASNTPTPGVSVLEVWLGPTTYVNNVTNPSLWTPVATATGNVAMTTMVPFTLSTPLCLGPGTYGVALKSLATATAPNVIWGFGYTNGGTCTSTTIPGSCTSPASLFSNADMTIRAGAAQNAFLAGGVFTPRVWNGAFHYTQGGSPIAVASWENYGTGCNRRRASFYELSPNPASFDLSGATGSTLTLALNGAGGYQVTAGGTPYTPPSPAAVPVTLTQTTGNETFLASSVLGGPLSSLVLYPAGATYQIATDLEICTDGYISPVPASNPWSAPNITGFLNGATRWAPYWKNTNASSTGLGNITLEVDAQGNLIVSWNGVQDESATGVTTTSSFQVAYLANGNVEYRYAPNMSIGGGGNFPVIVGWTLGGGALVNEMDISVMAAGSGFTIHGQDNAELTQVMDARPRLGTSPNFVTSNCPVGTSLGVSMLSFVQVNPGVSLASFGAPSCFQYQGAEVVQVNFGVSGGQFLQNFPIPLSTAYNGLLVYSQSAALAAGQNQLGILFSNGTRMFMGSL
jgi:hypothetical protein